MQKEDTSSRRTPSRVWLSFLRGIIRLHIANTSQFTSSVTSENRPCCLPNFAHRSSSSFLPEKPVGTEQRTQRRGMSASQVDPHDKKRARDVSKVTRGEQAPRPAHEYGTVSPPPPPSSTDHINVDTKKKKVEKSSDTGYLTRQCYVRYVDYHRWAKASLARKIETYCIIYCLLYVWKFNQ